MKIVRAEAWAVRMPMEEPYAIAYAASDTAENIFLRIVCEKHTGVGCAAPSLPVTGESASVTLGLFQNEWLPALTGRDVSEPKQVLAELRPREPRARAALAAIDMALLDLQAKSAGLPLWKYLGGARPDIATSITIGILPELDTVTRARHWVREGFTCLKIKGGNDWQSDAARVRKVREAVGKDIKLRFDANQGYTVAHTKAFLEATLGADLELLEQPTPKQEPEQLNELRGAPVPIMADESLFGVDDALTLARIVPAFNIKLMKSGGILSALPILEVAKAHSLRVMIGCMDESALGIAAGLALACGSDAVTYADLDGHIGLQGDPAAGAVTLVRGRLLPSSKPGLGIDL